MKINENKINELYKTKRRRKIKVKKKKERKK